MSIFNAAHIWCTAKGYPPPLIHWMLRKEIVKNNYSYNITYYEDCPSDGDGACVSSSTIHIGNTLLFNRATYSCIAINSAGNDSRSAYLHVTGTVHIKLNFTFNKL